MKENYIYCEKVEIDSSCRNNPGIRHYFAFYFSGTALATSTWRADMVAV
ncbi:MAG: hypothetical protein ACQES4_01205 [Bacillota bacterium]